MYKVTGIPTIDLQLIFFLSKHFLVSLHFLTHILYHTVSPSLLQPPPKDLPTPPGPPVPVFLLSPSFSRSSQSLLLALYKIRFAISSSLHSCSQLQTTSRDFKIQDNKMGTFQYTANVGEISFPRRSFLLCINFAMAEDKGSVEHQSSLTRLTKYDISSAFLVLIACSIAAL